MGPTERWLLDGDVSIRWQVLRDLLGRPSEEWEPVQALVATEGWGRQLLDRRDAGGRWTPRIYGRKWISTTYSMVLLRQLGLPADEPGAARTCQVLLDEGLQGDGGINVTVTEPRSETCVSGMVLGILSWFGCRDPRRELLVDYLLREQLADGGWNCLRDTGSQHSSFHTTINVLEGLRDYVDSAGPRTPDVAAAEARGHEFLFAHRLFRSHRTGAVVQPAYTRFSFPPRWHYDVLRGLDHLRVADAAHDPRVDEAIALVRAREGPDGRWRLQNRYAGATFFEMEEAGRPSRWNTLRALRVLAWDERVRRVPDDPSTAASPDVPA